MLTKTFWFTLSIALAGCGGTPHPAPTPPPAAKPATPPPAETPAGETGDIVAQAALAEQYDAGKKLYFDKKCASCHGDHGEGNPKNPSVIGADALPAQALASAKLRKGRTFETAKDVLDFVQTKMPIKSPGSLSAEQAAAVTAWMLSESKVAIAKPLDAANAPSVRLR